ncbi:MAG: sensor histidine kinase [Tissierellia bacterium]|nr:sensor histidine kinase [Tissierellia bacterium]
MDSNERRITSITSELINNSLEAKASKITVSIERDSDKFQITVKDNGQGMDEDTLKEVRRILNQPFNEMYDEYYKGLAGSPYTDSPLNIIGFQVHKAEVQSDSNGTSITVMRKLR